MSFERDALRGRLEVQRREIARQRNLADAIRAELRRVDLSLYGEVDLINTVKLLDNVQSLCDAVDSVKKLQAEIDRLEDELNG